MYLALPLVAVIVLEATPVQMGILSALSGVPAIFGLFLGSWADRRQKRPILVWADLTRAVLMAAVPITHVAGVLTIEVLYVVSFGLAALTLLFQIGYRAMLPAVVERSEITEANSKLELATAGAGVAGPAGVGPLVQLVTAPISLIAGSILYLASAVIFLAIKSEECVSEESREAGRGIKDGLSYFWRHKPLVGIVASSVVFSIFATALESLALLYMVRELGLNPGTIGLMITVAGTGLFMGSIISGRYMSRIGAGRATTLGLAAVAIGDFSIPLASGPLPLVIGTLVAGGFATQIGIVLYNVGGASIRQSTVPDALQARLTSISVVFGRIGVPVGGLLGGFLGEWIGLRETLFIAACGLLAGTGFLVAFRTWHVRLPDPAH